jgi:hypothetical protein
VSSRWNVVPAASTEVARVGVGVAVAVAVLVVVMLLDLR